MNDIFLKNNCGTCKYDELQQEKDFTLYLLVKKRLNYNFLFMNVC